MSDVDTTEAEITDEGTGATPTIQWSVGTGARVHGFYLGVSQGDDDRPGLQEGQLVRLVR